MFSKAAEENFSLASLQYGADDYLSLVYTYVNKQSL